MRLSGCNLRCDYCDTPEARERSDNCQVIDKRGKRKLIPNPIMATEAAELIALLRARGTHSVSLTGGEPLVQADELAQLLPLLKKRGMSIYLESNGTLPEPLREVLPWLDWVAMDVKLPSSQGGHDLLPEHSRFLEVALSTNLFIKMVIGPETGDKELSAACTILGERSGDVILVLQPETTLLGQAGIPPERVKRLHEIAAASFEDVRVIPQMHRLWGIK